MRLLIALLLSAVALWRTDFSPDRIAVPLIGKEDCESSVEVPKAFRYLGRGQQAFAFESEDGKFVLKLFNRSYLEPPPNIPFFFRSRKKRWKMRSRIYPDSYRLACERLTEETGVVCVHVGKCGRDFPIVEVVDRASRKFKIDLNRVPFVLQKKGRGSFFESLKKDPERLIDAYLAFHAKRIGLRIVDFDRDFKHNFCWDGERLQSIDSARLCYDPNLEGERLRIEWWKTTRRFRKWLKEHAPEQVELFDEKLSEHSLAKGA